MQDDTERAVETGPGSSSSLTDTDTHNRGATPEFMRFLNIEEEGGATVSTGPTSRLEISFDNLEAMLDSLHRAENEFMDAGDGGMRGGSGLSKLKPEFTPLLSPVIPQKVGSVPGSAGGSVTGSSSTSSSTAAAAAATSSTGINSSRFSPLSSPLLEFHRYQDTNTLRKRVDTDETSPNTYKKPRTPSTSPLMAPRRPSSAFVDESELVLPPSQKHLSRKHSYRNNVLINPHHHKSATSSPVILPSSMPPMSQMPLTSTAMSTGTGTTPTSSSSIATSATNTNTNTNSNNNTSMTATTTTIGTTNAIGTNILSHFHADPSPSDKKTSHKLAEQGRRNRMNVAIQDLDSLIPEEWKKDITVPSKATTVELGCRYIRYLLEQKRD